jgi:hypothetical protein
VLDGDDVGGGYSSYGYHADGKKYADGKGEAYGSPCTQLAVALAFLLARCGVAMLAWMQTRPVT